MSNLDNKYKERSPEETIKILKDFFTQRGYILKKTVDNISEVGTYSCRWDLFIYDTCIMGANGKGMTREYSEASGLAELYERFCGQAQIYCNLLATEKYKKLNYTKNGYYFSENEHIGSVLEPLNIPSVSDFLNNCFNNLKDKEEIFLNLILEGNSINVPFKRLSGEDKIEYIDPRILFRVFTTSGFAAGNTETEALNQAMSELYERLGEIYYFMENQEKYYAISLDSIKDTHMYNTYKSIIELGYEIYILDLSYNFKFPTLMSILINKNFGNITINFGSFPIFDIALERIITELYQGITSFDNINFIQTPYINKNNLIEKLAGDNANSLLGLNSFNEEVLTKITFVTKPSNYFLLEKNLTNEQIKERCIELNKELNLDIVYRNNSLCSNMSSVCMFIFNKTKYSIYDYKKLTYNNKEIGFYSFQLNSMLRGKMVSEAIKSKNFDYYCAALEYLYKIITNENFDGNYVGNMMFSDWAYIWSTKFSHGFSVLNRIYEPDEFDPCFNYKELRKYRTIKEYKEAGYDYFSICDFFKKIGFNITLEDWNNIEYNNYVIYYGYFKPMIEFYFSDKYDKFISTFIK